MRSLGGTLIVDKWFSMDDNFGEWGQCVLKA